MSHCHRRVTRDNELTTTIFRTERVLRCLDDCQARRWSGKRRFAAVEYRLREAGKGRRVSAFWIWYVPSSSFVPILMSVKVRWKPLLQCQVLLRFGSPQSSHRGPHSKSTSDRCHRSLARNLKPSLLLCAVCSRLLSSYHVTRGPSSSSWSNL